jgi:hypothetical protein
LYGAGTAPNFLGGDLTITKNQNTPTLITLTNLNSSATSSAYYRAVGSNGYLDFGRTSSTSAPYKIILANDSFINNGTSGNISILNDVAAGTIKFAAGASSTAQMTLTAAGRLLLGTVS